MNSPVELTQLVCPHCARSYVLPADSVRAWALLRTQSICPQCRHWLVYDMINGTPGARTPTFDQPYSLENPKTMIQEVTL